MALNVRSLGSLVLGVLAASPGLPASGKSVVRKPNILFILTDDHRADALGYAGNPIIRTPHMDRMAMEGAYFRNALVTTPICAASRASILTGMYERTHGYTFQQGALKKPFMDISYPVILRQNGYYTGFYGKLGVEYGKPETLFDQAEIYDRNDKFRDRKGYYYKTIGKDTVHLTRYTGYKAREFIRTAPRDRPFCLSLSFSAPHAHDSSKEQYFWDPEYNSYYSGENIPPPVLGGDEYFSRLPKEVRDGYSRTRWGWRFDTPEKYRESVRGYYRMITQVDDEIGGIRSALEEEGLDRNTVIILMGDNGYFLGERQLADKWLMYDLSLKVPLIILDPKAGKHRNIGDMVLNIDIARTITDLAGAGSPEPYQGISLVPYLQGRPPKVRRPAILIEHLWNFDPIPSSEGIRTNEWKYFRYRFITAPEELYNLKKDPLERINLAADPKYRKVLEALRKECESQIARYTAAPSPGD